MLTTVTLATLALAAAAPLTPDAAVALALTRNPDLRAARHLLDEAAARARTTGRLNNPELDAELAGGAEGEGRLSVGVTQRFPLTARLRLERRRSALDVEAARLEVSDRERQLAAEVRTTVIELAALRAGAVLAERRRALAAEATASAQRAVAQGAASALDLGEAELTARERSLDVAANAAVEAEFAGRLATLIGGRADRLPAIAALGPVPAAVPANRTPGNRPDVQLAELAVRTGEADVALARATRWDDVGVGVFVEGERFRDEPEGIEPEALAGVRVTVPLPLWQNGSGAVAEKQAATSRRADQLAALRLAVLNETLAAHRQLAARHRSAREAELELLPAVRRHLAAVEDASARGEASADAVFRARERLLEAETVALEARRAYHLAHAHWLAALGAP